LLDSAVIFTAGRLQGGNARSYAFHCSVGALARSLLQVRKGVGNLRIGHS
jgi:hypothetical protein